MALFPIFTIKHYCRIRCKSEYCFIRVMHLNSEIYLDKEQRIKKKYWNFYRKKNINLKWELCGNVRQVLFKGKQVVSLLVITIWQSIVSPVSLSSSTEKTKGLSLVEDDDWFSTGGEISAILFGRRYPYSNYPLLRNWKKLPFLPIWAFKIEYWNILHWVCKFSFSSSLFHGILRTVETNNLLSFSTLLKRLYYLLPLLDCQYINQRFKENSFLTILNNNYSWKPPILLKVTIFCTHSLLLMPLFNVSFAKKLKFTYKIDSFAQILLLIVGNR